MTMQYQYTGVSDTYSQDAISILNTLARKHEILKAQWCRIKKGYEPGVQGYCSRSLATMKQILEEVEELTKEVIELEQNIADNPVDHANILDKIKSLAYSVNIDA